MNEDLSLLTAEQLEQHAQSAAERRLAYGGATIYGDDAEPTAEEEFPGEQLLGPFCGCDTCIVREVLDAGWPYVLELARRELRGEVNVNEITGTWTP